MQSSNCRLSERPIAWCIYLEHDKGNAPIRTTIQRINDMDSQENEQIIAEEAKGGWTTRLAA